NFFNYHLQKREWRSWFLRVKSQFTQNSIYSQKTSNIGFIEFQRNFLIWHIRVPNWNLQVPIWRGLPIETFLHIVFRLTG
ncbi:hypothetical protein, partial [Succinimonas amylolytica]|uniref:hypothetical protein n=1 Tax=Succinimonas amylolytica TaxID=83769 RepID=UPI001B7FA286